MVFKNLFRRKGRTILTLVAISIGVAAIIALGSIAEGIQEGFMALTQGSQADLVLSKSGAMTALMSSIDEDILDELRTWREVADADGILFGNALTGDSFTFLLGYHPDGFAIEHFHIIEGTALADARGVRGRPLILGWRAAETRGLQVGDAFHITGTAFRIVGIYETGDSFEDGAAVIPLEEAQLLSLQQRQVSVIYVRLRDDSDAERLQERVERNFSDIAISTTAGFSDQEQLFAIVDALVMGIAGLAVVIGGIGMTNALFMSVFERTREIGLLRSLGWSKRQVLGLILSESMILAAMGGAAGIILGIAGVISFGRSSSYLGVFGTHITFGLILRALVTVGALGLVGGALPAWWASRLVPLEALRYEGGSEARIPRRVPGGMTVRNLMRRRTLTALTLLGIGVSIAAIVAFGALATGMNYVMTEMWRTSQTDILAIEAGVDSDFSALDERMGSQIGARSDVDAVSGVIMTAVDTDRMPMMLMFGYHPRSFAIRHFRIIEGEPLTSRHQVIVGHRAAEQTGLDIGDTLRMLDSNFRVVGIYETGVSFEDIGVVISLREAQAITGKPRQVMMYGIKLDDPGQAERVRDELEAAFPEADFSLTADVAEIMSDMQVLQEMVGSISFMAILIGAVGMLNTMLMSVLERTREIGVLRALGWRRRQVLGMVLRESLVLGVFGGILGMILGVGLGNLISLAPGTFGSFDLIFPPELFLQAAIVSLIAGAVGGLYPGWRATRMLPVEALRYE